MGFECVRLGDCGTCQRQAVWLWRIEGTLEQSCGHCLKVRVERARAEMQPPQAVTDTCKNGHTGQWLYRPRRKGRVCVPCKRDRQRKYLQSLGREAS